MARPRPDKPLLAQGVDCVQKAADEFAAEHAKGSVVWKDHGEMKVGGIRVEDGQGKASFVTYIVGDWFKISPKVSYSFISPGPSSPPPVPTLAFCTHPPALTKKHMVKPFGHLQVAGTFEAAFDRGGLVAVEVDMRHSYVDSLTRVISAPSPGFIRSLASSRKPGVPRRRCLSCMHSWPHPHT